MLSLLLMDGEGRIVGVCCIVALYRLLSLPAACDDVGCADVTRLRHSFCPSVDTTRARRSFLLSLCNSPPFPLRASMTNWACARVPLWKVNVTRSINDVVFPSFFSVFSLPCLALNFFACVLRFLLGENCGSAGGLLRADLRLWGAGN